MTTERIIGDNVQIECSRVHKFYEQRARQLGNDLSAVNLTGNPDVSQKRDALEKKTVLSLLNLKGSESVLEIGCGLGRFPEALYGRIRLYLGVDQSAEMIRIAHIRHRRHPEIRFQSLTAEEIAPGSLLHPPPFDLLLTMGLFVYLNDVAADALVRTMGMLAATECRIYVRETVSLIGRRLTLNNFFSQELGERYSAIYRTPEEYEAMFRKHLFPIGFTTESSDWLLTKELGARKETNQRFFLLSRKGRRESENGVLL